MKDQWIQISCLYHEALKPPKDERAAYLKKSAPDEEVHLEFKNSLKVFLDTRKEKCIEPY